MTIQFNGKTLTQAQEAAVIAGLRQLATTMESGAVQPNDGDVGDILTAGGQIEALSSDEVYALGDRLVG